MEDQAVETYPVEMNTEQSESKDKRKKFWRFVLDVIETLVLSALLYAAINTVSARIRVDGSSMLPTLHNHEYVFVNKLAYKFNLPKHGDVIVFYFPRDPEQEYIKRVIGLPGDHVQIADGKVFVNDQQLVETYISDPPSYQNNWIVPEGTLFVLGDNRNSSSDSHSWGPLALEYVIGKALLIYWPLQSWSIIQ